MKILVRQLGLHLFRGQMYIDDELVFSVEAPELSACCQFLWQHKSVLDAQQCETLTEHNPQSNEIN